MKTLLFILLASTMTTGKVFTSPTGKKYHTHRECQYLKNSSEVKTMTLKQAKEQGKTICSRCKTKDNKK